MPLQVLGRDVLDVALPAVQLGDAVGLDVDEQELFGELMAHAF
jgi:hypothetical protein